MDFADLIKTHPDRYKIISDYIDGANRKNQRNTKVFVFPDTVYVVGYTSRWGLKRYGLPDLCFYLEAEHKLLAERN